MKLIKLNLEKQKRQNNNIKYKLNTLSNFLPTLPTINKENNKKVNVTVDGSLFTINAQFGPISINNPNALMRNTTASTMAISYETRLLGPTRLPIFTPPPLPPTKDLPTFFKQVNNFF